VRSTGERGGRESERVRPRPRPRSTADVEATTELPRSRPAEPEPEAEAEPVRSRSNSRAGARKAEAAARRLRKTRVNTALVIVLVVAAACLVPQVRTVLRQSFTRLPQASTAIYFTENPKIQGTELDVPITVKGVNTGVNTYGVKVWTETSAGKVDGSTTAKIPTKRGVTSAVVTLPIATDAAEVWVSLDGTSQVLHFQI